MYEIQTNLITIEKNEYAILIKTTVGCGWVSERELNSTIFKLLLL